MILVGRLAIPVHSVMPRTRDAALSIRSAVFSIHGAALSIRGAVFSIHSAALSIRGAALWVREIALRGAIACKSRFYLALFHRVITQAPARICWLMRSLQMSKMRSGAREPRVGRRPPRWGIISEGGHMANPFPPNREADLVTWTQNFSTLISSDDSIIESLERAPAPRLFQ